MKPSKTPSKLSDSSHRQLNSYALVAGAAGVGALALASPAQARIIYKSAHVEISPYKLHAYNLDLNHDRKTDFVLQSKFYSTTNQSAGTQRMLVSGAHSNAVASSRGFAGALKAGAIIGPADHFKNAAALASDWGSAGAGTSVKRGPWINVTNHYLGLKFQVKGQTHYGWARLTVKDQPGYFYVYATLTGYAYETVANKTIVAGKTKGPDVNDAPSGSLGSLARGAATVQK